jgi:hypothetical protein
MVSTAKKATTKTAGRVATNARTAAARAGRAITAWRASLTRDHAVGFGQST